MADQGFSQKLLIPVEDYEEFLSFFQTIKSDILSLWTGNPSFVNTYYTELLDYNVFTGKHMRAQIFLLACSKISKQDKLDQSCMLALAWALEIIQAASLIGDDISDSAELRRGQDCWHLKEHVGTIAVNDMILLENACYFLLRKYCRGKSFYLELLEMFQDNTLTMCVGQGLDLLAEKSTSNEKFSMSFYKEIAYLKTAYFGVYFPIATALIFNTTLKQGVLAITKNIAMEIGLLYQVQDDYIDLYGQQCETGKTSSDISNGKCAWPIVTALDLANPTQRAILQENYGHKNEDQIDKVKSVFEELNIKQHFRNYVKDFKIKIDLYVNEIPDLQSQKIIGSIFERILARVFKTSSSRG